MKDTMILSLCLEARVMELLRNGPRQASTSRRLSR